MTVTHLIFASADGGTPQCVGQISKPLLAGGIPQELVVFAATQGLERAQLYALPVDGQRAPS